jgi:hypothetical protein
VTDRTGSASADASRLPSDDAIPSRRRRIAILLVFVLASGAVIATTPAIATSHLSGSGSTSVEVTADRPAVRGHFSVDITAAALPATFGVSTSGSMEIRVGPSDAVVTLVPRGGAPSSLVRNGSGGVDVGRACPPGRHCTLAYDLLVEPVARPTVTPRPDSSGTAGAKPVGNDVSISVSVSLLYSGRDLVPPDATITVAGLDSFTAVSPAAGRDAEVGEDELVVGPDHPVVVRELELELSAAAVPRPIVAPLSGTLDVEIQRLDQAVGSSDRVGVEIVPEESLGDPPSVLPRAAALPVRPFASCPANESCRRRVLLVFEWLSQDPTKALRVGWQASAHVRYEGMDPLQPGATLTMRTVDRRAAGDGGATVTATTDLTVSATTAKYGSSVGNGFVLTTDARTLDADDFRGIPPPSIGLVDVSVRTADRRPVAGDATVEVRLAGPDGTLATGYPLYARPVVNGAPVRMAFQPLRTCESGQPCKLAFTVGMSAPGEDTVPIGTQLVAEFHVSTTLLYVSFARPPVGAALHLERAP